MPGHDIIVIGASAGGVKVLTQLAQGLPAALPAALFVVSHISPLSMNVLPEILSRSGRILAHSARDGEPIYPGHIYVAPPDQHLLLEPGHIRLSRGPRENFQRPAIDPLFRSAARCYGRRVVGVILTGALHDGVAGLMSIRAAGGIGIIQDPKDAEVPELPRSALEIAGADYVVTADQLAPLLVDLIRPPRASEGEKVMAEVDPLEKMPQVVVADMAAQARGEKRGTLATFTCPECGGNLWQVDDQKLIRFSCHVGHAFHGEDLLGQQAVALEAALWTATRIFKEKTVLARQLAAVQRHQGNAESAVRFEEEAQLSERYSVLIQEYLLSRREGVPSSSEGKPSATSELPG